MVDTVNVSLVEYLVDCCIQILRGFQIVSERLLQDDSSPALVTSTQAGMRQAFNNWARHGSRSRNVKQPVRTGARALHLVHALPQTCTELFVVDVPGQVMH